VRTRRLDRIRPAARSILLRQSPVIYRFIVVAQVEKRCPCSHQLCDSMRRMCASLAVRPPARYRRRATFPVLSVLYGPICPRAALGHFAGSPPIKFRRVRRTGAHPASGFEHAGGPLILNKYRGFVGGRLRQGWHDKIYSGSNRWRPARYVVVESPPNDIWRPYPKNVRHFRREIYSTPASGTPTRWEVLRTTPNARTPRGPLLVKEYPGAASDLNTLDPARARD